MCLGLALLPRPGSAAPARHAILLLFPYQSDLPAYSLTMQAMQEEFSQASDLSLEVYSEYLDLNRFDDAAYEQALFAHYALKYRRKPMDLVASERMLDLWLAQRAAILPDTPVVFYDIVTDRITARQLPPDVTGVTAVVDHTQSVRWFLRVYPAVNEVVIVHGVGAADQSYLQPVEALKADLQGQVQVTDWADLPLAEIKRRAAVLPKASVIMYHLMFEDAAGVTYRPIDALRELAAVSAVPVLSGYDQFIGTGTVGGYMYSIEQQAREAARLGLRLLRGEPIGAIPVQIGQGSRFIFDHLALQRYAIPLSTLPPDSLVKNRQYSVWELYRPQIAVILTGFILLLGLTAILFRQTRQLNAARQGLARLNLDLEAQVQARTADLSQANRRLQQESAERARIAEQLMVQNAELDAFAHTVAHDLKNPVSVIIGFAGLLASDYETMPAAEVAAALRDMYRTGQKLDTIIEELMLLAGVRKQEVVPTPFDMGRVVQETIQRLQTLIRDQQAQITWPDEATWPAALGYAPWVEEVWVNYIGNAIKYGGRPPRVELGWDWLKDEGGRQKAEGEDSSFIPQPLSFLRFWVRDNGPGLSAQAQKDVFAPFTRFGQVHATGHGLGLSIVQRIVEKLGGQVGVESEPGRGSLFFFTLPAGLPR